MHTHTHIDRMFDENYTASKKRSIGSVNVVDMTPGERTVESQVQYTDQASQSVVVSSDDIDRGGHFQSAVAVGLAFSTNTIRAIRCDSLVIDNTYGNLGSNSASSATYGKLSFQLQNGAGPVSDHNIEFQNIANGAMVMHRIVWDYSHTNHLQVAEKIGLNFFKELALKIDEVPGVSLTAVSLDLERGTPRLRVKMVNSLYKIRFVTPHVLLGTHGYTVDQLKAQPLLNEWFSPNPPHECPITMAHLSVNGFNENTMTSISTSAINTIATSVLVGEYGNVVRAGPFPTLQLETTRRSPGLIQIQLVTNSGDPVPPAMRWFAHLTLFK